MVKIKVYLDNCAYNRPFDDQTQIKIMLETEAKRHIQRLIVEKKIELVYSFINRFENSKNKKPLNRNSISSFFTNAVLYIDHTSAVSVGKRAVEIIKAGIRTKDAYHISCAIESGCRYFITTDKPLLKHKHDAIIICSPVQFLDYYEEEQNGTNL
jgi:predicted nucleic acid-binding protein